MQVEWTEAQRKFIEWLACPRFERIPPTILMLSQELGFDESTLHRWKKLDGFQEEVNQLARKSVGLSLPTVYGALIRRAEAGEYQHIQLLLELAGEYTRTQRNVNQSDVKGDILIRFVEEEVEADGAE